MQTNLKKKSKFASFTLRELPWEVKYQKRIIKELSKAISQCRRDILELNKEIKLRKDSKPVKKWKKNMTILLHKHIVKGGK